MVMTEVARVIALKTAEGEAFVVLALDRSLISSWL